MPVRDRLSRRLEGAVLLGTCALALSVPRLADACGASIPELTHSVPADGASYPANAALLFSGFEISLDAVTVTVDGQPAAFVPAEFATGMADIAVLVDPAPQAGQTVVVAGNFCAQEPTCEPVEITYTASAPDDAAPAPIVDASFFAVLEHDDFAHDVGCGSWTVEQTMYVHLQRAEPTADEAPAVMRLSWDPDGDGPAGIRQTLRAPQALTLTTIAIDPNTLGGADVRSDVCLEVTAIDAAGNAAAPFELCPPCFFREDPTPLPDNAQLLPEPVWTEADAVPGSACAPAAETTGGDDSTGGDDPTGVGTGDAPTSGPDDPTGAGTGESGADTDSATGGEDSPGKGCACRGDAEGPPPTLLLLLAAGLLRRRRGR